MACRGPCRFLEVELFNDIPGILRGNAAENIERFPFFAYAEVAGFIMFIVFAVERLVELIEGDVRFWATSSSVTLLLRVFSSSV
ncbi:MAG: hypothetical protein MZV70_17050 [Desulfobacterales bacterium]|nr:hypothetical protein [Desulfobacterales bacterium]